MSISCNDAGTYPLIIARIMLGCVCLSPHQSGFLWRFLSAAICTNIFCTIIANTAHIYQSRTDFAMAGSACTSFSAHMQIITKFIFLNYYKKDLAKIWKTIDEEFWPANITDKDTERSIRNGSRVVTIMICVYLTCAFFSAWDYNSSYILSGQRILPIRSTYPFDWQASPMFEVLTVWHSFLHLYVIIYTIGIHDYFLNSLVSNCTAQFKLLQTTLLSIGTGKDLIINRKLNELGSLKAGYPRKNDEVSEEFDLVAKCVEHHNRIINVCDTVQRLFGATILLQFFLSAFALCISTFVLTQFEGYLSNMMSFAMAHLMQLFFLCAVANELIYESLAVGDAAYCSSWYENAELRIRSALILIIQRAQREVKLTAAGFANLDYPSFVEVLRFSFSFYTLLGSIQEKKN